MGFQKKEIIALKLSRLLPYFILFLAAIIAFLPLSSMQFAIKNDAIALDYPVKYFISQCLHNNVQPFWFNTWAMGFPIESIITWSLFSPLQFFFGGLFHYNLYTFHAEFIFYIAFSGCNMYYFLEKHISKNPSLNLLLAACYMLSGFTVGSSQWLIYMSAQALIPLVLSCCFSLLKTPSTKNSLLFVAVFYTMLTSVYLPFTIIVFYLLLCLTGYFLFRKYTTDKAFISRSGIIRYLILTVSILIIICIPAVFYTFQVLQNIKRGEPVTDIHFFNSNFIPIKGFLSFLVPLSAPKMQVVNTEGTMSDLYMGLLPLLLIPLSFITNQKLKSWSNYIFLFAAIFFLILSTGHITPVRQLVNILPGFSYFRNPGLFRLFFILFILIYLSATYSKSWLSYQLFKKHLPMAVSLTSVLISAVLVFLILRNYQPLNFSFEYFSLHSLKEFIYKFTYQNLIFISACIQLTLILACFCFYKLGYHKLLFFILLLDPILNCLLCTPFFTVSSFSVKQTNDDLLKTVDGFPIQRISPVNVPTSIRVNEAVWYNSNVYQKKVSSLNSYFGPLTLKRFQPDSLTNHNLILFSQKSGTTITITNQKPNYISASINVKDSMDYIFFQQNLYPGWKAYFNKNPINIQADKRGIMKIQLSQSGIIEFKYKRKYLFIITILINCLIIGTILFFGIAYKTKPPKISAAF